MQLKGTHRSMHPREVREEAGDNATSNKLTLVAGKLVRFVMSVTESQNTIISKGRLQKRIKEITEREQCGSVSLIKVLKKTDEMLNDIYGYTLQGLPLRGSTASDRQVSTQEQPGSRGQYYILLDNKKPISALDDFVFSQEVNNYVHAIQDGQYIGNKLDLEVSNTLASKLKCDSDIAVKGLLSVVLCVIFFSNNHAIQQELYEHLEKFGIPTDGSNIPIVDITILELLRLFEKQEYIARNVEHSGAELEVEIYRIGRRTKAEFPAESLVHFVRVLMGIAEEQAPNLKQDIERNIADSYAATSSS